MKLFNQTLDTVLENGYTTTPLVPSSAPQLANGSVDPAAVTTTLPPGNQVSNAIAVRQQLQADRLRGMSVDQKIDLALKQATEAQKVAYGVMRDLSGLNSKLDRVLVSIKQPAGQSSQKIYAYDEDDPESIMSQRRP